MKRVHWGSKIGFIFAVAGSAVGLANIWRFPYVVGNNGGAVFVLAYLICLALIGFPVFIAEMLIGKTAQTSPSGAFRSLGGNSAWSFAGKMTILTGFIVSSFYSAVAGWILGYLVEAVAGNIVVFQDAAHAQSHYASLMDNPYWGFGFYSLFLFCCTCVLYLGVRRGIERANKIFMPILFVVLILLMFKGLTMPGAKEGLIFLFNPDWSQLTPTAIMIALGQAFFTLSLGQGTMVTYGSYLEETENIIKSSIPVVLMDTFVSIFAAITIFTIVFSGGMEPNSGPGLIFHTLPLIFSQLPGGHLLAVMFFLLVLLAAITSQISAMEPAIAYLIDERKWVRHKAVIACGIGVFLLGIPSALSYSVMKNVLIFGMPFLDFVSVIASNILIPLGGFAAVILVGWRWGANNAVARLKVGAHSTFTKYRFLKPYFVISFKYTAPLLIIIVFINAVSQMYGK